MLKKIEEYWSNPYSKSQASLAHRGELDFKQLIARVKELESKQSRTFPSRLLKYCKEHKTICMEFNGKLACCLEARIKGLEEQLELTKGKRRKSKGPRF